MAETIIPITCKAGIARDGTAFDAEHYIAGEWVRFWKNKPRKIGGYRNMNNDYAGPIRQLYVNASDTTIGIYAGSPSGLEVAYFTEAGFGAGVTDVTPLGYATDNDFMWQFDAMFDPSGLTAAVIFAHGAANLNNVKNQVNTDIYYSDVATANQFAVLAGAPQVSGGICVLFPYLMAYGNNGLLKWCDAGDPTNWTTGDAGDGYIANSKIIRGYPFRGGTGASPGGLFFSLDSLYRVTYNSAGPPTFNSDFVGETLLMGANAVVELNGLYYWVDKAGRFCVYNGTIREIENALNKDFFFDNINKDCYNKVVATTIPRYGEVWYMFCKGDATENNWAIIHNTILNTWYDTPLPEGGRTAAFEQGIFNYPVWAGNPVPSETDYILWMHEFGFDKLNGTRTEAIRSNFETNMISQVSEGLLNSGWSGKNQNTLTQRFEPDFIQNGDMTFQLITRKFPKSPDVFFDPITFTDSTEYKDLPKYDGRILRFKIESNTQGGYYNMGNPLINLDTGGSPRP